MYCTTYFMSSQNSSYELLLLASDVNLCLPPSLHCTTHSVYCRTHFTHSQKHSISHCRWHPISIRASSPFFIVEHITFGLLQNMFWIQSKTFYGSLPLASNANPCLLPFLHCRTHSIYCRTRFRYSRKHSTGHCCWHPMPASQFVPLSVAVCLHSVLQSAAVCVAVCDTVSASLCCSGLQSVLQSVAVCVAVYVIVSASFFCPALLFSFLSLARALSLSLSLSFSLSLLLSLSLFLSLSLSLSFAHSTAQAHHLSR